MKVRINIGKEMNLGFEIPDGMEYNFLTKVLRDVRSLTRGGELIEDLLKDPKVFADTEETVAADYPAKEEHSSHLIPEEEQYGKYRGFLYIKCRHCGKERGFNAKKPLTGFHCECGQITELEDLEPMWVNCECGRRSRYLTNMDAKMFDMECLDCGNLVTVVHNTKKHAYETIREDNHEER